MSRLKPNKLLLLIAVPFHSKMMQFLLTGFHSANWINNAAILVLVWISGCGLYACHKKMVCVFVCVLAIFEREQLYCKLQIQLLCAPADFCWHLTGKIWYCAQTESH